MASTLLIIGSGLAGYNLAREYRKLNKTDPVLIVTADDGAYYSKPMLSNALAKHKQPAELVMASATKMAADLNAEILTGQRVTELVPAADQVKLATGNTLEYQQCVLAIGASPLTVPIAGNAQQRIYHVNDLQDYARFRQAITGKQRIAIVGPGLIGCEFANDLAVAGYQVEVIGPDTQPLGRLVPVPIGHAVQQALAQLGVRWHLQTTLVQAQTNNNGVSLQLANGTVVEADVILSAIGLQPNGALAKQAGLKTQRGIVVDRQLRSSVANVYALGDCAEVDGLVLPYVLPLMQGTRALAKTLNGEATAVSYPPMPVLIKTPACPVVVSPPPPGSQGEWQVEYRSDGIKAVFSTGDSVLGFALSGGAVNERTTLIQLVPPVLN